MRKLLHAARASLVLMLFLMGSNSMFAQTYCSVTPYACLYGYNVNSFVTSGAVTNISSTATGCSGTGYSDYTAQVMEAYQGSTFSFTIGLGSSWNYLGVNVFIDWNNDGDWSDTGEKVFTTTNYASSSTLTGTVDVPMGAELGETRIRIYSVQDYASYYSACSTIPWYYGEIEDYTIDILEAPDCAETPFDTDILLTSVDSICPSVPFTLSLTDVPMVSGATRTWQSSPAGTATWTSLTGTSLSYAVTGITAATDYRFIITCTATGVSDTSNVKTVNVKPGMDCYCTPTGTGLYGCSSWRIDNFVTTGGVSNISNLNSNCAGSSMYGNYTDMLASQFRGSAVNFDIKLEYTWGTTSGNVMMWIDWDQSGTFDSDEDVYTNMSAMSGTTLSGTFEVPDDAVEGTTRIRIKTTQYNDFTDGSACTFGSYDYVEIEDYAFEVFVPDPCEDVAMTSVTLSGPDAVCSGSETFSIVSTGTPIASGLTKVWESRSPAGSGTWTTITGASMSSLAVASITAETEYRYTVTCTATGESTTDSWTVGLNPPTDCYCTPSWGYGCLYSYNINDFWTTGATTDISNLGTGCASSPDGGYSDYTDMEAEAFQGTLVNYNITLGSTYQAARMWIDWDQSGTFDSDEVIYSSSSSGYAPTSISGSFEVPYDATPGVTGMRIRTWSGYGYDYYGPCYDYEWGYGETEDYKFNVVEPPPCDEVAFTGLEIEGPENICAAVGFTITSTGTPVASGITRIWQSKTETGAWTTMTGTSLNYTVAAGITESMSYRYINICTLNGESDTSNVWSIDMNPPLECYCVAEFSGAWYMDMYTWYDYKIKDVILNGQTDTLRSLNTPFPFDGTTLGDLGGYTDYTVDTPTLHIPDLIQTGTYTGQVKVRYSGTAVRVWIDLDDDGVFESTEAIYTSPVDWSMSPSTSAPANFTWTVPEDANPGIHRMRVRTMAYYHYPVPMDPCYTYEYGQTQDYLVEVKKLQDCDEVTFPTSVMAYSSPPNVCGTGDIQLRLGTTMPLAAGVTYQWKSSSTEDGTYANVGSPIAGILGPVTTVTGVAEDTYFKCYVLCEGDPILISDAVLVQSVNLEDVEISIEDGQTCGPGTVTLTGTTTDGSIFWYENPEGGSPIYMGDEFTTPSLSTDRTYYATGGAFGASDGIVGDGTGTSYYYDYGPFTPYYGAKTMQYLYQASDLHEAGLNMGGDIESLAFNLASVPDYALNDYKIYVKTTTASTISWQTSGWTEVFNTSSLMPEETGWQVFPFSTAFEWDGSSNIMVKICYTVPDLPYYYYYTPSGTHKYTTKPGSVMYYYNNTTSTSACDATFGYTSSYNMLPNAKFYIPGCETDRVPVTAYVRPVPAPVNIGADETVCKDPDGGRTLDVGVLPDTYTRLWSNGETAQTTRITESGTYSIIVANEYGCEVYDTVVKTLLEIPIVDLGEDMTVCEGGFVTLDAGDDGTYYMWNTGTTTNTYDAYSEGTYNVLVENSAGCISLDTITLIFEGHMPSVGSIITTNTGEYTFNFEPILTDYVVRYEWDFGDDSPISESSNPTHTYSTPGSYTVTLTVYSTCGERTYTTTTHILGVNSANIDDKSVNLYPNPAKDIAVIESKGNLKMKTVTVTNVLGQVMYQGEATAANRHQLELSAYASGLYTVRIETDKGFIVRKFEIIK